ncbi:MAG: amino acid racemase [Tissierellales bacterium]|nr:amino acid racemase [Tissierellales bacterium]
MKTIGIIGGMGPLATVKLFEKIVLNTSASSDQEHPPILIDNNTKIPDRTNFILKKGEDPRPELIKSAKRLEISGADFLIMPCNNAHYFYEDIISNINIPLLNMIEIAVDEIKVNYRNKKVGILGTDGTIYGGVYQNLLERENIDFLIPSNSGQKVFMKLIYSIKKGKYDNNLADIFSEFTNLKNKGVEIFIVGCTELSVAVEIYNLKERIEIVDSLDLLAKRAIIESGANLNKNDRLNMI